MRSTTHQKALLLNAQQSRLSTSQQSRHEQSLVDLLSLKDSWRRWKQTAVRNPFKYFQRSAIFEEKGKLNSSMDANVS